MSRPRRKLARPGDVISYSTLKGMRRGTVVRKFSDYLEVKLDEPRELDDFEKRFKQFSDPYVDNVYYHSDYVIERYVEDGEEVQH